MKSLTIENMYVRAQRNYLMCTYLKGAWNRECFSKALPKCLEFKFKQGRLRPMPQTHSKIILLKKTGRAIKEMVV